MSSTTAAAVRRRINDLVGRGAHPGRGRPIDRELSEQLDLLRALDPAFAARSDKLAGLDPVKRRASRNTPAPAPPEVRYAALYGSGITSTAN